MIDLKKVQKELAERKDDFWARKVLFLAGCKAAVQALMEGQDAANPSCDLFFTLLAKDIVEDLKLHYPGKDTGEMSREMIEDCDALLELVIAEAIEQVNNLTN